MEKKFQLLKQGETEYEILVKCFTNLIEPVFYYVFGETLTKISNSVFLYSVLHFN